MTIARTDVARVSMPRLASVFLGFFCFVLAGYAIGGKGFAYLGFPPLYIGEITLALGIAAALTAGNLTSAILTYPGIALALLMLWTALRTIPYWDEYRFNSLRDAVIVFYGLFAYIVASLILKWPRTLTLLTMRYKRFIPILIFLAPIVLVLNYMSLYSADQGASPLLGMKAADLSCHFTAIIAFALTGFIRLRPLAFMVILSTELFAFTQTREAMAAFTIGCFLSSMLSPDRRALPRICAYLGVLATVVGIAAVLGIKFNPSVEGRTFDARQLVANATSIFTHTDSELVGNTKEWRLNWWSDIIDYTVHGPYFWTGKGFGPNLADSDGYQTSDVEAGEPPLRSPHSAHMTILARGGVPGLVLWIGALGSWLFAVMRQLVEARKLRDEWWIGAFAFLLTYWTIMLISASFDVALEGPVLGIWFWTVHGIGLAALVLHRHRVATLQNRLIRTKPGSRDIR
jgi:hypothetical protein